MTGRYARFRFARATIDDTATAQDAYREIIDHLARTVDFPHWHTENHPTPTEVVQWIADGVLYLALAPADGRPDRIAGVVVLDHHASDDYRHAAWAIDASPEQVLVVHALGVSPRFLRRGVARFLVDAGLDLARQQRCTTVRLDTYVENLAARELYTRCGFTDLGPHTVTYAGSDLNRFHLFEYVL